MSNLTNFLRARLNEDETAARDLEGSAGLGHWDIQPRYQAGAGLIDVRTGLLAEFSDRAIAAHIARHDPARVLRRVAAGRELLAEHDGQCCVKDVCCGEITDWYSASDPCPSLRAYGIEWDDHPDYRAEWKP